MLNINSLKIKDPILCINLITKSVMVLTYDKTAVFRKKKQYKK